MKQHEQLYSIAATEREVGLSKDVLRVWERRYGFPTPLRDARGDRLYSGEQVARLRLIKRLMDAGHRPGRLLARSLEALQALAADPLPGRSPPAVPLPDAPGDELFDAVVRHDAAGLSRALQHRLAQAGLASFVQDTMVPLTAQVGHEWARGRIQVFEEHLFTEAAVRVLRQAIATMPPGNGPTVLLTTVPDEPHGLGLLMVESLLVLEGARCINLGTQLPPADITRAVQACRADVVGLSFSTAFPTRRIPEVLRQLRSSLDPAVQLWAGGGGMRRVPPIAGVTALASLADTVAALAGAGVH